MRVPSADAGKDRHHATGVCLPFGSIGARLWGNERFGDVVPFEQACLGVAQHDAGHTAWKSGPHAQPTDRPSFHSLAFTVLMLHRFVLVMAHCP
jgi:hypothetical protein